MCYELSCKKQIEENYRAVLSRVEKAAIKSGRKLEDITLIAVSKTKPVKMIDAAFSAGATDFGENRVQELTKKFEYFSSDEMKNKGTDKIKWHQIGRLQKNKVKYLIGKNILIHSVDSYELAEEISKQSCKHSVVTDVLLQINISGEESKGGISPQSAREFFKEVSELPGIHVKGLMTVPEKTSDTELLKKLFSEMNGIFLDIFSGMCDNINNYYLSMGMSNDFEIAIECGSNMVRVGTAIFGARDYAL